VAAVRASLSHAHLLEVEVDTPAQLDEALAAGVQVILLDNMDVAAVRAAVARTAGRAVLEVSGGVRLELVREYAATGVDVISVGALTTAAPWIDLSLVVD
jgi:nicotinate-nucleotide pyrophosphorylase (carboxylating)